MPQFNTFQLFRHQTVFCPATLPVPISSQGDKVCVSALGCVSGVWILPVPFAVTVRRQAAEVVSKSPAHPRSLPSLFRHPLSLGPVRRLLSSLPRAVAAQDVVVQCSAPLPSGCVLVDCLPCFHESMCGCGCVCTSTSALSTRAPPPLHCQQEHLHLCSVNNSSVRCMLKKSTLSSCGADRPASPHHRKAPSTAFEHAFVLTLHLTRLSTLRPPCSVPCLSRPPCVCFSVLYSCRSILLQSPGTWSPGTFYPPLEYTSFDFQGTVEDGCETASQFTLNTPVSTTSSHETSATRAQRIKKLVEEREGAETPEGQQGPANTALASENFTPKVPEPLWNVFNATPSMLLLDAADTQSSHSGASTASSPNHRRPGIQVSILPFVSPASPRPSDLSAVRKQQGLASP